MNTFLNRAFNIPVRYFKMSVSGRITQRIQDKVQQALQPTHMEVINESFMHSVPKDSETHFKVVVVSGKFEGMSLIQRHRLVNETLSEELQSGVHALSIVAKTPDQWSQNPNVAQSPPCMGGMKTK